MFAVGHRRVGRQASRDVTTLVRKSLSQRPLPNDSAIAAADGAISYEENEQVRRITKAMHIPHQIFKESKKKFLKR